ncbi:MAG: hypothetical protein II288_04225 [Alistipes sp.]|jgi:uncharacterized BrkB/YihY/UPF0761 family membrane protein|nr:hypothetical protein [Alistipes sp.]
MDTKTLFWLNVALITLLVLGLMVLWHFFMNEIVWTLGWLLIFALIFGAGWLLGRHMGRRRQEKSPEVDV